MRAFTRSIIAEAKRLGLTEIDLIPGGKHSKLVGRCGAAMIRMPVSSASGNCRSGHNIIASLRRKVRAAQATATTELFTEKEMS